MRPFLFLFPAFFIGCLGNYQTIKVIPEGSHSFGAFVEADQYGEWPIGAGGAFYRYGIKKNLELNIVGDVFWPQMRTGLYFQILDYLTIGSNIKVFIQNDKSPAIRNELFNIEFVGITGWKDFYLGGKFQTLKLPTNIIAFTGMDFKIWKRLYINPEISATYGPVYDYASDTESNKFYPCAVGFSFKIK